MNLVAAVIVAAGDGKRFGERKQFVFLKGKPVLEWTLEAFNDHPEVDSIILVLPGEEDGKHYVHRYDKIAEVVRGGERRQDSVWQGFRLIDRTATEVVLVHDGARPFPSRDLITRVIVGAREHGAVVPVVTSDDTLKEVENGEVLRTLDRGRVFRAQTPQGFRLDVLQDALEAARKERFYGTDESLLVEKRGHRVVTVQGEQGNIKITNPQDIRIAEALLGD